MKTYTEDQIRRAISRSYERNSFNDLYFWSHLKEEEEWEKLNLEHGVRWIKIF